MFRDLPWRSALNDLVLRGALSLIVCALAALCVLGVLSAIAANLGPKERSITEIRPDRARQETASQRLRVADTG